MKCFTNPIIPTETTGRTSDPYVLHLGEWYYQCYSTAEGVFVAKTKELADLDFAEKVNVFPKANGQDYSNWYAPELHFIDGVFYIYGAPEVRGTHVMCVLQNKSADPMSAFSFLGEVEGLGSRWNIDGTVAEFGGKNYFLWSSGAKIHLAELIAPNKVNDNSVVLIKLEYDFEKQNGNVCEAPAALQCGDKLHIIYSVNDSRTDNYCMGRITFSGKGDILDINNWEKSKTAVFSKTNDIFGPGHCSFTTVNNNGVEENYMLYHANLESGSGWNGRSVWAQSFGFDSEGYPVFGKPHK